MNTAAIAMGVQIFFFAHGGISGYCDVLQIYKVMCVFWGVRCKGECRVVAMEDDVTAASRTVIIRLRR